MLPHVDHDQNLDVILPHVDHNQNPVLKMVCAEPCKELRRRPQLFIVGKRGGILGNLGKDQLFSWSEGDST